MFNEKYQSHTNQSNQKKDTQSELQEALSAQCGQALPQQSAYPTAPTNSAAFSPASNAVAAMPPASNSNPDPNANFAAAMTSQAAPTTGNTPGSYDAVLTHVGTQLTSGVSQQDILSGLMNMGYTGDQALQVINQASQQNGATLHPDQLEQEQVKDAYMGLLIRGGIVFLGGCGVTVGTYLMAAPGGTYIVAFGAILWGGYDLFRGISGYLGSSFE